MALVLDRPDFEPRPLDYIEFLTWETSTLSNGGGAFTFLSVIHGELDERAVTEAWYRLCRRHPMLGATIEDKNGALRFVPLAAFPSPHVTISSSDSLVEELLTAIGDVEFPEGSPLYQAFAVLNPSTRRHVFATVINHAAGDGAACHNLHDEFSDELINSLTANSDRNAPLNRALPGSWCERLLPSSGLWPFLRSGAVELTRPLHCQLVPFETKASFHRRRTRHLIAIADPASTTSVVGRASRECGMSAYLSARLLEVQHAYMAKRGLIKDRARLVLTLPTNIRRFAPPNREISLATFPHFAGVDLEKGSSSRTTSERVRSVIDRLAGPRGLDYLVNWYSPALTRVGLRLLINSNVHLGPYTTHLGRIDLKQSDNIRRVAAFGFLNMRHGLNSLQASTRIENGRLVIAMNYCDPVVKSDTAQNYFREFLDRIGIDPLTPIADNYDHYVNFRQQTF